MRSFNSDLKRLSLLSCVGITAIVLTACGGGGGGGGNVTPIVPATCLANPAKETRFPSQNVTVDQVFHNYTKPDSNWQIYGYENPNPLYVKTIKITNNYSKTIYPILYSPTAFTGSDGEIKNMSRIYVGKPACNDPDSFYAGIPSGGSASVYVPKQMWNAGHVKIFTEAPPFLQEDTKIKPIVKPIYTVDRNKNSPNLGYLLYTSGTPADFPPDYPFQLTEYTIESTCALDKPECAKPENDKLTVDFDISGVVHLFLPIAMQELTGSRGYVGTGMKVEDFQTQLKAFVQGKSSELSYSSDVGWPFFYGSNKEKGYLNGLFKIPMGYDTINLLLFPTLSPYGSGINSMWVYNKDLIASKPVSDSATLLKVKQNLEGRWANFWGNPNVCVGQDPTYCGNFKKTMDFLRNNIVNACKYHRTTKGQDPNLCITPRSDKNLDSVLTDIDKIQKLVGYDFPAITFSDPGGPYPAVPDDMCTVESGPIPPKNGEFYSNCFRDALKSVLRGVPYPFWLYRSQYNAHDISSIYTLIPSIWFTHTYMNLSEYAFSVDDDIGNQELVGNGFQITVGGLNGLVTTNAYGGKEVDQILSFPGGVVNPQWQGTVSSSKVCIPPKVAGCDLNLNEGGYKSVEVSLTGIPGVTNPDYFLKFTVTPGTPQTCTRGSGGYTYTPLVISNCSTSAGLKNCEPGLLSVTFSSPTSCAQTVSPSIPTT